MRKPVLPIVLASLLLFVGACENESGNPTQPVELTQAPDAERHLDLGGCWEPTSPEILADLTWEEFSGTLQPGFGGMLIGQATTWGSGCYFGISVPPEALPGGLGPTDFSLKVPTKASYLAYQDENCGQGLPLIMRIEPHGLVFLAPVSVTATYMPWTGLTAADVGQLWSEGLGYGYQIYPLPRGKVRLEFGAPHFSDWEFGGPLIPPDGIVPIEFD